MQAKLSVKNVSKIFGDKPDEARALLQKGATKQDILEATGATVGVRDATFDVSEGEIFVIMGLSGSGKSTLVRMLNGLIPATTGSILIDGDDIASASAPHLRRIRREKIAMVFQHFSLFPHWTVAENVAYGLKVKGVDAATRDREAREVLDRVGLAAWADALPSDLSGGMQQRVGIARGLASGPEILLMDEPFGALDPLIRREMQEELIQLQRKMRKTIVFITHDLNEAMMLGDRIAIMKDGAIVQIGTAQEIVTSPADDYVAAFVADIDRGRVFTVEDISLRPAAIQLGRHTATAALKKMEESEAGALHVLDGDRIVGIVTYRDLAAIVARKGESAGTVLEAMREDFPSVDTKSPLADVYEAAGIGLPVAVTDRHDRLVGVVEPKDVLAQLATSRTETNGEAANEPR